MKNLFVILLAAFSANAALAGPISVECFRSSNQSVKLATAATGYNFEDYNFEDKSKPAMGAFYGIDAVKSTNDTLLFDFNGDGDYFFLGLEDCRNKGGSDNVVLTVTNDKSGDEVLSCSCITE